MSVQKIFITLIIVVICVVVGAFVLNTIMPNVVAGICNTIENGIKSATGISFDLNGDGVGRTSGTSVTDADSKANTGVGVGGFTDFGAGAASVTK